VADLKEIESFIKNINYYSQQIANTCTEQFTEDAKLQDINAQAGSIRFDSLGAIVSACTYIDCYCLNILANIQTAMEQGKILFTEEVLVEEEYR